MSKTDSMILAMTKVTTSPGTTSNKPSRRALRGFSWGQQCPLFFEYSAMQYFKITFKDDDTTDSMAFAANNEAGAFAQLEELCGPLPRKCCTATVIPEAEYFEMNGGDEASGD
jgi:hypothetical protein